MESFTVNTRLTKEEYAKVMFVGLYRRPVFILATIVGLYLLATVVFKYTDAAHYPVDTPTFDIVAGLFILLAPLLILLVSVKQFASNPSFQRDIVYTFSDNGIAVKGLTFKSEFVWAHIIKQKEIGKFLILYHNKKAGNFIDKTKLTIEQIAFIKAKIKQATSQHQTATANV